MCDCDGKGWKGGEEGGAVYQLLEQLIQDQKNRVRTPSGAQYIKKL